MSLIPLIAKTATRDELIKLLDDHDKALRKAHTDHAELLAALDTLTLVVGLTPITGNKDALQEAMDIARAAIAKHKAGKEG